MLRPALLLDICDRIGTPCFIYDVDGVRGQARALREAFDHQFKISYAVKSNPNLVLLRRMRGVVDTLDISSEGELRRALEAGWRADQLSFTGPGKRDFELKAAVGRGIAEVILESAAEAERLDAFALALGVTQRVLVRINPAKLPNGFGIGMAGKPSQFGIDEEQSFAAVRKIQSLANLKLCGFHIYAGTQCLRADVIARAYECFAILFQTLCSEIDISPEKLVFGSGLGVPYHEGDEPVDVMKLARLSKPQLDALRGESRFRNTQFVLETGRYLVGEAGLYLTRVVSTKHSRGTEIRICDGGMNHHLAAAGHLGSVIPRNYRMSKVSVDSPSSTAPPAPLDLCGPLCTSIDVFGRGVMLPDVGIGDVIAIQCSGAYGVTASPIHFISHQPPREILVEEVDGQIRIEDATPAW